MTGGGAPLIVGLGGTTREGSSTERALCAALATAEAQGARRHRTKHLPAMCQAKRHRTAAQ